MKSMPINQIRKRFHREWLLIAVDKMDADRTLPLTGRLLAHSPHQDEIDRLDRKYRSLTLTVYSADTLPKGYAVAFHAQAPSPAS